MKAETSVSKEAQIPCTTRLGGALAQAEEANQLNVLAKTTRDYGMGIGGRSFTSPSRTAEPNNNNNYPVGDRRHR